MGQLICGSTAGCIAVYQHDVDDADNDDNQGNANNKGDACKANDHHD